MNGCVVPVASLRRSTGEFFERVRALLSAEGRLVTFYARPDEAEERVALTVVISLAGQLEAMQTSVSREAGFPSLSREFPAFHIFEREIFEAYAVRPHDHPWLKPVRFSGEPRGAPIEYPFYDVVGKEVHEVGVGPIHAGVIEPGHFRFHCLGERVLHLEIQLGFQHRGVEALLLSRPPATLGPLVETIAGDSSVAHAWAYCGALEALSGTELPDRVPLSRGIALELERIAMHLASLSGLAADIAFLPGAATYGRLRTTAINTAMLLCGSRLGRGWLRPGTSRGALTAEALATVRQNLALLARDVTGINTLFLAARSVQHRLKGVGVVSNAQVTELGFVGMVARSSGVALDARSGRKPGAPYAALTPEIVVEPSGDCWARALLRIREIDVSLHWLQAALELWSRSEPPASGALGSSAAPLRSEQLSVCLCEGWRGEVVHCLETDAAGGLRHYRVQDPSLRNWLAVALAVRDDEIYDFPICNKSFDLSYAGNDL